MAKPLKQTFVCLFNVKWLLRNCVNISYSRIANFCYRNYIPWISCCAFNYISVCLSGRPDRLWVYSVSILTFFSGDHQHKCQKNAGEILYTCELLIYVSPSGKFELVLTITLKLPYCRRFLKPLKMSGLFLFFDILHIKFLILSQMLPQDL